MDGGYRRRIKAGDTSIGGKGPTEWNRAVSAALHQIKETNPTLTQKAKFREAILLAKSRYTPKRGRPVKIEYVPLTGCGVRRH